MKKKEGYCECAKMYIVKTFDDLKELFLSKNADYGDSVFNTGPLCPDVSPEKAVAIRMEDKIKRLSNLMKEGSQPENETITDTLKDLAVYSIILASMYNTYDLSERVSDENRD